MYIHYYQSEIQTQSEVAEFKILVLIYCIYPRQKYNLGKKKKPTFLKALFLIQWVLQ